jgi:hypothetical protein
MFTNCQKPASVLVYTRRTIQSLLVLVACLAVSANAQDLPSHVKELEIATEIDLGSFCLTEMAPGTVHVENTKLPQTAGVWFAVQIRVDAASKKPKAFFFKSPRLPNPDGSYESCSQAGERDVAFLKGRLNSATINALYKPPTEKEGPRWQIEKNNLDVEFGKAEAKLSPLFGGYVVATGSTSGEVLTGRLLKVTNHNSQIFYNLTANIQRGALEINTTDVLIKRAHLQLSEDASMDLDLTCTYTPQTKSVTFPLDVSNGAVHFSDGVCQAGPTKLPVGHFSGSGLSMDVSDLGAGNITLKGVNGAPQLFLKSVDITAKQISYLNGMKAIPSSHFIAGTISGPVESSPDRLKMSEVTWNAIDIKQAQITLGDGSILSGPGSINLHSLGPKDVNANIHFDTPALPALSAYAVSAPASLNLLFIGPANAPSISGAIRIGAVRFGALQLSQPSEEITFALESTHQSRRDFSFAWDVSTPEGTFVIGEPAGQNIALTGQLQKMLVKGMLSFDSTWSKASVNIPANSLVVSATAKASVSPLVLGSPVSFLQSSIRLSTATGFTIGSQDPGGTIDLSAGVLIFTTPSLAFADPNSGLLIQAPLTTDGTATLRFDIGSGQAVIQNAHLVATKLSAKPLEVTTEVTLAGLSLSTPLLTLDRLELKVADGKGTVFVDGLDFVTDDVTSKGPPYWRASLPPGQGLKLTHFEGQMAASTKTLDIASVIVKGFSLKGPSGEFRSADGFSIKGTNFELSADELAEKQVTKGKISIASGALQVGASQPGGAVSAKANFANFAIGLNGSTDKIDGDGGISLSDISIDGKTTLAVGPCNGWKVTGAVDIARVDLALVMQAGQLHGDLHVNQGKVYIVNDGYSKCEFDKDYIITEEKYGQMGLPCWKDWHPDLCQVKTIIVPEIKGKIHWIAELHNLQISGTIADATLHLGGQGPLSVCFNQIVISPPLIVASYFPGFQEGPFGINLLRDVTRGIATLVESSLAEVLGTSAVTTTWINVLFRSVCFRG